MVPRGEVGLVCAQPGLSASILNQKIFSALVVTIIVTTLVTPPMLKFITKRQTLTNI